MGTVKGRIEVAQSDPNIKAADATEVYLGKLKVYLNPADGKACAALYNPGHGGNGADYSDVWNQFYCLDGVWDDSHDTEVVSPERLQSIVDEFQSGPKERESVAEDMKGVDVHVVDRGICLIDIYRAPGDLYDSWDIVEQSADGSFPRMPNAGYGPDAVDRLADGLTFKSVHVVERHSRWDENGWAKHEATVLVDGKIAASYSA